MRGACLEFVTVLREAAERHGATRDFERQGFGACDALRARLRDEGFDLTDRQTEDAYLARVRGLAATGDYMLTAASAQRLRSTFGELTVDAFASGATALLSRFWSAEAVAGAEGTDAFKQSWAGERLLVHAPVERIADVIEKLEATPAAAAVVVTPNWTGAPWFGPLKRLAADSLILPAGSLRAVAQRTDHVKSWRAVAFYVPPRDA